MKALDQLEEYINKREDDRFDIVHLGDIFESRATVSFYILSEVLQRLKSIYNLSISRHKDNRMIFVAGNHDFYSPNNDVVNSLDVVIKEALPGAHIVSRDVMIDGGDMYVPWYWMNERRKELCFDGVERVFTHCDCSIITPPENYTIYSGHIHNFRSYPNMYNLSPPYSLDFGDSNDETKGIWILSGDKLSLIKNVSSIRYRSFSNEQIFDIPNLDESIQRGDNFRLYINESNRSKIEYIDRINSLCNDLKYVNTIIVGTDLSMGNNFTDEIDINDMLLSIIPDHLIDHFNKVRDSIKHTL